MQDTTLAIANPLPLALAHYVRELEETLDRVGRPHRVQSTLPVEGTSGIGSKLRMLANAVKNPLRARRSAEPVILLWPSLGLLDTLLWRSRKTRHYLVLHDPIPIRKQVGYGKVALWLSRLFHRGSPTIITHSDDAHRVAQELLPKHTHIVLPHPILTEQSNRERIDGPPVVAVAGQFKPERNIKLLEELGPTFADRGWVGKIYGRGWPTVSGWEVDSRFLSEAELDAVLAGASVILIPYSRYYQSGIAIRALELGTMSLSPETAFARDVLGDLGIVDKSASAKSWFDAIEIQFGAETLASVCFEDYQSKVDGLWLLACEVELTRMSPKK